MSVIQRDYTVDSVLTHTSPWTPPVMGFRRVWVLKEVIIYDY